VSQPAPRICVVHTGGTIASKYNANEGAWQSVASAEEIAECVPGVGELAQLSFVEHSQYNGYRIPTGVVFDLCKRVRGLVARDDVDGLVVIHGTATLEETAYMLDLTVCTPKPIVCTAAQRRFDDLGSDGPPNFLSAVRAAASPDSRDRGVLVAFDGELHSARDVTKVHPQALTAFASRDGGAVGYSGRNDVVYWSRPERRIHLDVESIREDVQLIKMAQGADDLLVRACIAARVGGIVVEGISGGHVTDKPFYALLDAMQQGIPVVVTPRTFAGDTAGEYAHPGSNLRLRQAGAIKSRFLGANKARILLMVALGSTTNRDELAEIFSRA
jgi:L-asparaginase